ncbi:leucyl-tRNA synthetase [Aulographum hederae CBS 113979]|uniref:leucine--tRNA ligase n=1 Tax=Aulographum hederae CBS 113979 TaxID=1176131 RepID=A0A6G1HCC8_9PEZI|nr:leucyl-tRNA synthetase [Aulographum hederae CBS 113979]
MRSFPRYGPLWTRAFWAFSRRAESRDFIRSASTTIPKINFAEIDAKWRRKWEENALASSSPSSKGAKKEYVLPMFPYPSGSLHLGHLRVYTIADVLARFKQMQGSHVIHAMGWDAFGLPAENAAIERGVDPSEWTKQNIIKMREQLTAMNGSWDWQREFATCDPYFYKHTQRLFLLLYENGLAYQANAVVNYDPVDKTVLANEQVDANGLSWRSGAKVEKKELKQWFLRITSFASQLYQDLDLLAANGWPSRVLAQQRHWLGPSKGHILRFDLALSENLRSDSAATEIKVFTTRIDTLRGVKFIGLSLQHPIVRELAVHDAKLREFITDAATFAPDSKDGYLLPGLTVKYPFLSPSGNAPDLPVYAVPYVSADYGTGAVMGVPAHDTRDHAFWRKHYGNEELQSVIAPVPREGERPEFPTLKPGTNNHDVPYTGRGLVQLPGEDASIHEKQLNFDQSITLKRMGELHDSSPHMENATFWRIRDWLISRQRYWGTPIPIIHCADCGPVPVLASDLPVELPKLSSSQLGGGNPLDDIHDWVNVSCPQCDRPAKRETDTMDTFMDSSWYFFRFADPHNSELPISPKAADAALPVDMYIGGVEHAILHLLYARFIAKFIHSKTALWPSGGDRNDEDGNQVLGHGEPFRRLITQEMVHGKTFTHPTTGRFLKSEEVDLSDPSKPTLKSTGETPTVSFQKMSKSKYNGVDPMLTIDEYGADVTRAHMLFQAPVDEVLEWDDHSIVGVERWFYRIWRLVHSLNFTEEELSIWLNNNDEQPHVANAKSSAASDSSLSKEEVQRFQRLRDEGDLYEQRAICLVTKTLQTNVTSLNTIVSDLIKYTNELVAHQIAFEKANLPGRKYNVLLKAALSRQVSTLCRLLAPVAPAFAEECMGVLQQGFKTRVTFKDGVFAPGIDDTGSVIQAWPEYDRAQLERLEKSLAGSKCTVQVNGKVKFAVQLNLGVQEKRDGLVDLVVEKLKQTEEGMSLLGKGFKGEGDAIRGKKVCRIVVVKGGQLVNFVVEK